MAKAVKRPAEAWTYVLVADRALPIEQQSQFTLKPLTHAERAALQDSWSRIQTNADGSRLNMPRGRQSAFELARSHIVSIENFPSDAPQAWPADVAQRAKYLEQLEDDEVVEVGNEIWLRSSVSAPPRAKEATPALELKRQLEEAGHRHVAVDADGNVTIYANEGTSLKNSSRPELTSGSGASSATEAPASTTE